jgi:hypothetical protein
VLWFLLDCLLAALLSSGLPIQVREVAATAMTYTQGGLGDAVLLNAISDPVVPIPLAAQCVRSACLRPIPLAKSLEILNRCLSDYDLAEAWINTQCQWWHHRSGILLPLLMNVYPQSALQFGLGMYNHEIGHIVAELILATNIVTGNDRVIVASMRAYRKSVAPVGVFLLSLYHLSHRMPLVRLEAARWHLYHGGFRLTTAAIAIAVLEDSQSLDEDVQSMAFLCDINYRGHHKALLPLLRKKAASDNLTVRTLAKSLLARIEPGGWPA